jgi:hypothetical protein
MRWFLESSLARPIARENRVVTGETLAGPGAYRTIITLELFNTIYLYAYVTERTFTDDSWANLFFCSGLVSSLRPVAI